jgi:hypothetical protein
VKRLESEANLHTAAKIAYRFNIDPVVVLQSDHFTWAVRTAAYNYITALLRRENEAAKNKNKTKK